jgi:hypothetical protein
MASLRRAGGRAANSPQTSDKPLELMLPAALELDSGTHDKIPDHARHQELVDSRQRRDTGGNVHGQALTSAPRTSHATPAVVQRGCRAVVWRLIERSRLLGSDFRRRCRTARQPVATMCR